MNDDNKSPAEDESEGKNWSRRRHPAPRHFTSATKDRVPLEYSSLKDWGCCKMDKTSHIYSLNILDSNPMLLNCSIFWPKSKTVSLPTMVKVEGGEKYHLEDLGQNINWFIFR